jgi:hypothetical protein
VNGESYPREEVVVSPTKDSMLVMMIFLWEKRGKYKNSPIVIYFLLAKVSDRIRTATKIINKAIQVSVIENK